MLFSGLDCFTDIEDGVWKVEVILGRADIEDVIDDINLVTLVDIFTGTSDIISCVVIDVVIMVEIYNVVSAVGMACAGEVGVCKAEMITHCMI